METINANYHGSQLKLYVKKIQTCCDIFEVVVGTDGTGSIGEHVNTVIKINVAPGTISSHVEYNVTDEGIEINVIGNSELNACMDAVKFIYETLKNQIEINKLEERIWES